MDNSALLGRCNNADIYYEFHFNDEEISNYSDGSSRLYLASTGSWQIIGKLNFIQKLYCFMKKCIYILVFFISSFVNGYGQSMEYCIKGTVEAPGLNTYAYLFINKIGNEPCSVVSVPIEDHRFEFRGKAELSGKQIATGFIFISDIANMDTLQVMKMLTSGFRDQRSIVLESLEIDIDNTTEIKEANVKGSKLNKDWDEMSNANKTQQHTDFVKSHSDSPVSIILISALTALEKTGMMSSSELNHMYSMLSDRMKSSAEGKELQRKLFLNSRGK